MMTNDTPRGRKMKRGLFFIVILTMIALGAASAFAQVAVTIPDTSGQKGSQIEIPVNVGDMNGMDVYSFDIWITFDPSVLSNVSLVKTGTMSDSLQVISNELNNEIRISGYNIYHPIAGGGTLFKLNFTIVGDPNDQTTLQFSRCILNAGSPATNPQTGTFTVETYPVNVTITTSVGAGTKVIVDGVEKNAPYQATWDAGSAHTINVPSPQNVDAGTRYVFDSWSDGGSQSHTVLVYTDSTFSANLNTQYLVTINSDHGNPSGGGWYNQGETAQISINTPVAGGSGTRYVFQSWAGTGSGSYSGTNNPATVTVNEAITETVNWTTQYFLTINSDYGNPTGEGWYDAGTTAQFSVENEVTVNNDTKYQFTSWTGTGAGAYSGANNPGSVVMNDPIQEQANWQVSQYYVATAVSPQNGGTITPAPPGQWVAPGTSVQFSASPANGYQFISWSGDLTGSENPKTIAVNSPKSVTANFGKQVTITITTNPAGRQIEVDGNSYVAPHTFTWLSSTQHTINIPSPQNIAEGERYVFQSWSDGGEQSHTITIPEADQTYTATLGLQYFLTTDVNPSGTGTVDPATPGAWYNANTDATITATANAGYKFYIWSGDISTENNPTTITMDQPKSVVANFQEAPYRINAGGDQYTDSHGNVWEADQEYAPGGYGYVGGRIYKTKHDIANTVDDELYKSERYRMSAYRFTVPRNGTYQVKLLFAEVYYSATGKRIFSVKIEGKTVITDLDIYDKVGHDFAMSRTFQVDVNDGILDIEFIKNIDNPKISAIEVSAAAADVMPPVISNVQATGITRTTATITWQTDEGATGQVEYGLDTTYGNSSPLNSNFKTSHSHALSGLTAGTTYHYRVRSVDASGNESVSGDYTFTTEAPDTTPPVISNVQATGITQTTATITWQTDEGATGQVEYGLDTSYGNSSPLNSNYRTSHSHALSGLTAGTTYHYRVRSTDASGNESVSGDYTFTTEAPDTTPPVISNVQATGITRTTATITWQTDEGATGQVEYGLDTSYGSTSPLNSNYRTSHSHALSGLTAGTTYHYRVRSTDASGNASVSGDYTFTTEAPDTTPPVISNVQAINVTHNSATITWTTDEGADSRVEYGVDTNYGNSTTLDASLVTSHSQTITGLAAGTTYHFRVYSRDESLNSSVSGDYTFTTEASQPGYTRRVNAGDGSYNGSEGNWSADQEYTVGSWGYVGGRVYSKTVSIKKTPDDRLYQSERYRMSAYRFTVPSSGTYTVNLHFAEIFYKAAGKRVFDVKLEGRRVLTDFDIYAEAGYATALVKSFEVKVTDGVLDIEFVRKTDSPKISAIEVLAEQGDDTTPPVISHVASVVTQTTATITWQTNERSDSQIEYGLTVSYGNSTILDGSFVTSHSQTISGLTPGTTYHYRVKSRDQNGNLSVSGDYTFTTEAPDVTPPVISDVQATGITQTTATITWQTDEGATGQVEYGLDTNYGSSSPLNSNYNTSHSHALSGLTAGTTYHYRVRSVDASGNASVSGDYTFTTLEPDVTPPVITNINVTTTANSATITWETNEAANSQIKYGLNSNDYTDSTNVDNDLVTSHSQTVTNLSANTTYYFRVKSADASGNLTVSAEQFFTTSAQPSYAVRVNAGGGEYHGSGKDWSADQEYTPGSWGYVGGRIYSKNISIKNTPDDPLYKSERYRMSGYRFTVPSAGVYTVTLHFAEIFYKDSNKRVFDVKIEGKKVLSDFDIYDEVGYATAYRKNFDVNVSDGILDIEFIKNIDSPKISAIEVVAKTLGKNRIGQETPDRQNEVIADQTIPVDFQLASPYPNPFNMETKIRFDIPETGYLFAAIYNIRGQKVITISDEQVMPGQKEMIWNGRDEYGYEMSSGIYLLKVVYLGENNQRISQTKRLILMK